MSSPDVGAAPRKRWRLSAAVFLAAAAVYFAFSWPLAPSFFSGIPFSADTQGAQRRVMVSGAN